MLIASLVLADMTDPLLRLLGRLHPAVVHFPIALVLAALAVEAFRVVSPWPRNRIRRQPSPTALTCVGLGAAGGAVAAWFGWVSAAMEHPGSSQAALVDLHRWIGIAGAGLALAVFVLGLFGRGATAGAATTAYRLGLFLAAGAIGVAGHFGASLVHGEAYLSSAVRDVVVAWRGGSPRQREETPSPRPSPGIDAGQFGSTVPAAGGAPTVTTASRVAAILDAHCVECHGPEKQKGRLRLDDLAALTTRDVIVPGDPHESELVLRISLPADDPDLMPPDGEPLDVAEIQAIRDWIASLGAATSGAALLPTAPPAGQPAANPALATEDDDDDRAESIALDVAAIDAAIAALLERGAVVQRVSLSGPEVEVDFSLLGAAVGDADLALLRGLEPVLVALDLGDTAITPGAAETLAAFTALEKLQLQRTDVTDDAMPALARLPALRTLNLYGTLVGDGGLARLRDARALRKVYAWDAAVTPEGAAAFRAQRPDVAVELGEALAPPPPAENAP